jgi:phosphatidylserine decarboxylase
MTIHREGFRTLLLSALALVVANALIYFLITPFGWIHYFFCLVSIGVYFIILRFFRVPRRKYTYDDSRVLSAADGEVVVVEKLSHHELTNAPCIQLSVFMSLHNVHFNHYPVSGRVTAVKYYKGKYLLARNPKASMLNESMSVCLQTENGYSIWIKQIAGIMARRVVCYAKPGEVVKQNDALGFIKFGSRVDFLLPAGSKVLVAPGDKVSCGITPVAILPE